MLRLFLVALSIVFSNPAYCQQQQKQLRDLSPEWYSNYQPEWEKALKDAPNYNFSFTRLIWNPPPDIDFYHADKSYWTVDYPQADKCLLRALTELTKTKANPLPVVMKPDDKNLAMFPFAFITEAGWVNFSDQEAKNLGQWLRKGGFLMVDDFHGPMPMFDDIQKVTVRDGQPNEWRQWMGQLRKMIPELLETSKVWSPANLADFRGNYVVMRLPVSHPIFDSFFRYNEIPHVKGMRAGDNNWEEGGSQHDIMGLFNPKGIMIALMNYNMDVGDGLEYCNELDKTPYGRTQVPEGLRLGINYVLYSLTH